MSVCEFSADRSIPLWHGPLRVSSHYQIIRFIKDPQRICLYLQKSETESVPPRFPGNLKKMSNIFFIILFLKITTFSLFCLWVLSLTTVCQWLNRGHFGSSYRMSLPFMFCSQGCKSNQHKGMRNIRRWSEVLEINGDWTGLCGLVGF